MSTSKPRTPVKRISEKRLQKLGGKTPFSSITPHPKRRKAWKRKPSEFKRIYGSKARVEFVKSLPCAACGVVGYSENAHVLGNGGLSRKAGYETIAPLCGFDTIFDDIGCHITLDTHRSEFSARFPLFDPSKAAQETENLWQSHLLSEGAR